MKKVGIVGGVGWPSTIDYYAFNLRFPHSAAIPLVSRQGIVRFRLHSDSSFGAGERLARQGSPAEAEWGVQAPYAEWNRILDVPHLSKESKADRISLDRRQQPLRVAARQAEMIETPSVAAHPRGEDTYAI